MVFKQQSAMLDQSFGSQRDGNLLRVFYENVSHVVGIKEDHYYLQKLQIYLIIELIHYMLFSVQDLTTLDLSLQKVMQTLS